LHSLSRRLHIVSFDVPYPTNYGGVIDVFFKIKELHKQDVMIYLHVFEYGRKQQKELEKYCETVFYYPRNNTLLNQFSKLPFIVKSRANKQLVKNLNSVDAPILFEGLQTTYSLLKTRFNQPVFVRTHNIEHHYYSGLASSTHRFINKLYYKIEARKLKNYEKLLHKVDGIFTISPFEQQYFKENFGEKAQYIPAFHDKKELINKFASNKPFILFHGDLRIADNIRAAHFVIDTYKNSRYHLIIASSIKEQSIIKKIRAINTIELRHIDSQNDLEKLLEEAAINILVTFQKTGIKLKLLNTLYQGKFIIANSIMVEDTGLEDLCHVANKKDTILKLTKELILKEFTEEEIDKRTEKLKPFDPALSAKKITETIFTNSLGND